MWNQENGDDDIETITVFAGGSSGTTGIWDPKAGMKRLAADASWALKTGGTVTVIVGGVLMAVGGVSAWTGGGAGVFVAGASVTLVGAGAVFVGHMLDEIVSDPPQPNYRQSVNHLHAGIDLSAFNTDPNAPEARAMNHLNHLSVLAVNILDAIERLQGAEAAKDRKWVDGWTETIKTLEGMFLSRQRGLANALADMATSTGALGNVSGKELADGLAKLQSVDGRKRMTAAFASAKVPSDIVDRYETHVSGLTKSDLPASANIADLLSGMAKTLKVQADAGMARY